MAKKMTEAEKQTLTKKMFAKMPKRLPKTIEEDVMKYALPDSRYLFFRNSRGSAAAVCSTCGKTVHFEGRELIHTTQDKMRYSKRRGYRAICPECKAAAITMAMRYGHKWLEDTARYMTIQAGKDGSLWLRLFTVRRRYPDNVGPL